MATLGRIEITTRRNGVEKTYDITPHQGNVRYLRTKQKKLGHELGLSEADEATVERR